MVGRSEVQHNAYQLRRPHLSFSQIPNASTNEQASNIDDSNIDGNRYPCNLTVDVNLEVAVDTVVEDQGLGLHDYMILPVDQYVSLTLPLGAYLERLPRSDVALFQLVIPEMQFFSLVVKPVLLLTVQLLSKDHPLGTCVFIEVQQCRVEGTFAEKIGLNDRFRLTGVTRFLWRTPDEVSQTSSPSSKL
ncbi:hypothetical protein CYMTET_15236 [Cymbomonas tetramitiformis]|uniref:Uncharacterized protein n=1 Tax=Cymbomonas tetramitiformis TaxID=36881 RepID=A0AAE0GEZ4_9CHLO|nr:hypothetical protein CYMTET_15236 [Cymbomonas tetramitiformis]